MAGTMDILIREMTIEDYEQIYGLWTDIKGFGIRSTDDSREGAECFPKRNPITNVVAVQNGLIIGNTLCGYGGRIGCFYHACVASGYRKYEIGYRMIRTATEALQHEGASKISPITFKNDEVGNTFWQGIGWIEREDVNNYESILNEENITRFVC